MDIKDFKHKTNITVRFSDLDAMKHVNNASYLTYLEEARIDYFNHLFNRKKNSLDFEAVIARIEIDYIIPIRLGDKVEVFTRTTKIGKKSIDVEHIIAIKIDDKYLNAAQSITKLVYYDYKAGNTKIIPDEAKETIAKYEGMTI